MSDRHAKRPGAISLEQLTALNDELAGLVRAGVPLELGLAQLGKETPGSLGQTIGELGRRMDAGESLLSILRRDAGRFPPVWRAVVEAGIRTGHLASALESMATTGRNIAAWRRTARLSMIYPVIVILLAYFTFAFLASRLFPVIIWLVEDFDLDGGLMLRAMMLVEQNAGLLLWLSPFVAAAVITVVWHRTARLNWHTAGGRQARWASWVSASYVLYLGRLATFSEVLALLVKHQVPLDEGIVLAAEACGDSSLISPAHALAARLQRGEAGEAHGDSGLPPLLGWIVSNSNLNAKLPETLEMAAQSYREKVEDCLTRQALFLPAVATVSIAGVLVAVQAAAILGPVFWLLYELGMPV